MPCRLRRCSDRRDACGGSLSCPWSVISNAKIFCAFGSRKCRSHVLRCQRDVLTRMRITSISTDVATGSDDDVCSPMRCCSHSLHCVWRVPFPILRIPVAGRIAITVSPHATRRSPASVEPPAGAAFTTFTVLLSQSWKTAWKCHAGSGEPRFPEMALSPTPPDVPHP